MTPTPGPAKPGLKNVDLHVGKTLDGRYLVEKVLGEGGMGVVYAARHTLIDKRVAVKILRSEFTRDKEILDRFVLEAKTASSIGNPHIVDISDFGRLPDGGTYFVMEFLEGEALADAMSTGDKVVYQAKPLALDRIYKIARQICDGLGAAHERGIVHRDLKPDNIFLIKRGADPDFVKILDFGIAKVTNENPSQKLTRAGAVFGTPQYMSPEQAAGGTVDLRADIYALGIILYEMVSGQLPFDGDNFMGILTQHMYKAPVPVRALVNTCNCPPGLEAVIQKCLQKRADLRYQTMAELSDDLQRLAASQQPKAIGDMMSRSSNASVPQDYFKSAQYAVVPGAPHGHKSGMPAWVWVFGVVGVLALVGGGLVVAKVINTTPTTAPTATLTTATPTTTATTTATPTATPTTAAPTTGPVKVKLAITPSTAIVKRDGKLITDRELEVLAGSKIALEIAAKGFETKTVSVDGSEPSIAIALDRERRPGSVGPVAHPPGSKGAKGTSGVVETW